MGRRFWSDGYWMVTVSQAGTENTIREYVKNQENNKYLIAYTKDDV